MRLTLAFVIAVAIAAAVFVVDGDESAFRETGEVTLVGDSLNVGTAPYLRAALDGWSVDAHDLVGRATAEGVDQLRQLGRNLAPVVVISLGTNDADGSEDEFRAHVDAALALAGPSRCVVWATIVRDGEPRVAFNDVLATAADANPRLRLLDWASLVAEDDRLLAADGVHGTPEGYERRAAETARVVRACAG
jgi:lysophospholipase L1-like esterase